MAVQFQIIKFNIMISITPRNCDITSKVLDFNWYKHQWVTLVDWGSAYNISTKVNPNL